MTEVVLVEAGRSPIGKRGGALATAHPADVLGPVQMAVLARAGVDPRDVGQVIGGCINKVGAQAMNITRTAWLSHGGPQQVAAVTVDAQCGSSQQAVNLAHGLIASGTEDVVLACGVENMSRIPIGSDAVAGTKAGLRKPISRTYFEHHEWATQFEGAERIATKYGITRADTDAFGLASQERAAKAIAEGRFDGQVVPIEVDVLDDGLRPPRGGTGERRTVTRDEVPRDTSLEALAALNPVARDDGIHTARVLDAVVCGRPSERWGAEVVAVVALRPDVVLGVADLADRCAGRLARYKIPKAVVVVDEVRRSPSGKPDVAWALAAAAGGDGRCVTR